MAAPITFRNCSSCISFVRHLFQSRCHLQTIPNACMSSNTEGVKSTHSKKEKDPFPLYASHEVQTILRRLTGFDLMKVAGPKKVPLQRPVYKLLTDAQLTQEQEAARNRLSEHLDSPPPYMNPRQPVTEPLAVDPDLAHFDSHKFVFSDISFGVNDRERSVVVREVDGTLRVAPWDLKERMNQLYNPREGRSIIRPRIFDVENIEKLISEKKFVYILERACAQFEPDDPDFRRACHRVYNAINATQQFNVLRSTRFFAPMTFHLVWTKMADSLLIDMLSRNLLSDAADLVNLYCMVHADGSCAQGIKNVEEMDTESMIKVFLETESCLPSELELALQAVMDGKRTEDSSSLSS